MEKNNLKNSVNRREFIKRSASAIILGGFTSSGILRSDRIFAQSLLNYEEPEIKDNGEKTWRKSSDLEKSELEIYKMDLTPWEKTPRSNKYAYVSAKLEPPYTAAEIAYMLTVGQYFPWWTHESPIGSIMINNRGIINYYTGQRELWSSLTPDTLKYYLYEWPEDKIYLWAWDRFFMPVRFRCDKLLQNVYRTGSKFQKYSTKWSYSNNSKKTVPVGEALYSDRYWERDFTYGDTIMVPWFYTWKFLGTDILYEDDIVRFPKNRKEISIRNWDEKIEKTNVFNVKIMGNDYPAYTKDGGVPCYVLEGIINGDFVIAEHRKVILWVDMYACRELRRERYDKENKLIAIMESRNRLELKDGGKWGYSILINLFWDLTLDRMSADHYDFHRFPRTFNVEDDNPEKYFRPNPIAMGCEMFPVPFSAMVFRDPEQFYLRPKLMIGKFPEDRRIIVSEKIQKLINAQDREKKLVFL